MSFLLIFLRKTACDRIKTAIYKMSNNKKKFSTSNVKTFLFLLVFCGLSTSSIFAQTNGENDISLTSEKQKEIIRSFSDSLARYYFFQDSAKIIIEKLDLAFENGLFEGITNDSLFAVSLTEFVKTIVSDNHLVIRYKKGYQPPPAPRPRDINTETSSNRPVPIEFKILEDNIGYLRIDMFDDHPSFYEKIDEVFQNLKGTKALIIDLSSCRGGSPRANDYVVSHLLQPNIKLTSIFQLINGNIVEFQRYSLENIKSEQRYTDKPVFVITGRTTFSAAESLCYDLQVLERAVVVGVRG
jgi:hypothetical protein